MEETFLPQENAQPDLPPAGYRRDEVLAERTDTLEQQAETQYADRGAIPHDHDALRPERNPEIQFALRKNYLDVGVNHPLYKTKWVNYVNQNGMMVWQAKADGWLVATAKEFPEAADMQKADGSLRCADVILMFIRHDEHFRLEERERAKRLRQQYGIEADIHDLAAKTNLKEGREVFTNVQTPAITGGASDNTIRALGAKVARRQAATGMAARHIGNRMKQGTIPGVPIR